MNVLMSDDAELRDRQRATETGLRFQLFEIAEEYERLAAGEAIINPPKDAQGESIRLKLSFVAFTLARVLPLTALDHDRVEREGRFIRDRSGIAAGPYISDRATGVDRGYERCARVPNIDTA
jgi:hypothetical protein